MAEFPIQYAKTRLRGAPLPRARVDTDTGGQYVGAGLAQLGGALFQIGRKIENSNMVLENAKAERHYEMAAVSAFETMQSPDFDPFNDDTVGQLRQQTEEAMQAYQSKYPEVNKNSQARYDRNYAEFITKFKGLLMQRKAQVVEDKNKALEEQYYESGDLSGFAKLQNMLVATGLQGKEMAERKIKDFSENSALAMARLNIGNNNPQAAIDLLTNADFRKGLSGKQLDYADKLLRMAEVKLRQNDKQIEQQRESDRDMLGDALQRLYKGEENAITYEMINTSSLEEKEQYTWTERMRKAIESVEDAKTNWPVYDSLDNAVKNYQLAPNPVARQQLLNRIREERFDNGNLSESDYESLKNAIESEISKEDTYWLKEARGLLDEAIRERDKLSGMLRTEEGLIASAAMAKMSLDKAMDEAYKTGKPIRGRDILIKAMEMVPRFKVPKKEQEKWPEIKGIGGGLKELDITWTEPETIEDFYRTVQLINQRDEDEARVYYEQWVRKFTE